MGIIIWIYFDILSHEFKKRLEITIKDKKNERFCFCLMFFVHVLKHQFTFIYLQYIFILDG